MTDLKPATPQPTGTPLAGYAVAVDVGGIEKELAALWRTQSKEKAQELTRACSWNLVVHCVDEAGLKLGKATADTLIHSSPTRTILVKNESYNTHKYTSVCVGKCAGTSINCNRRTSVNARVSTTPTMII